MRESFIDSDNKIIVSCPVCDNQNALYLIKSGSLVRGLEVKWCDNCNLPYIVNVKTELKCELEYYKTEKIKDSTK